MIHSCLIKINFLRVCRRGDGQLENTGRCADFIFAPYFRLTVRFGQWSGSARFCHDFPLVNDKTPGFPGVLRPASLSRLGV
jgi:hypothetical protein